LSSRTYRHFSSQRLNVTHPDKKLVAGSGPPPIPSKPDTIRNLNSKKRQEELEQRHQELLARQKQLQATLLLSILILT
jgi:hypothetical protein